MILSSSVAIFIGGGAASAEAAAAVAAGATRASDCLNISSRRSFDSSSEAALLSLAVTSSASRLQPVSSKICLFCSCVMVDGTCRVADESGMEEAIVGCFLHQESACYAQSEEQAYQQLEREKEAEAAPSTQ